MYIPNKLSLLIYVALHVMIRSVAAEQAAQSTFYDLH